MVVPVKITKKKVWFCAIYRYTIYNLRCIINISNETNEGKQIYGGNHYENKRTD